MVEEPEEGTPHAADAEQSNSGSFSRHRRTHPSGDRRPRHIGRLEQDELGSAGLEPRELPHHLITAIGERVNELPIE